MKSKWAVAIISFYDHELHLKIVEATCWQEALSAAFPGYEEYLENLSLEEAKIAAFNGDFMFECKEIT